LAELGSVFVPEQWVELLKELTVSYIQSRYPDVSRHFSKEFATKMFTETEELFQWPSLPLKSNSE
jgi:HEPN domain-containing protein